MNGGPISIAKAREQLNFEPTSLKEALTESIKFTFESMQNPEFADEVEDILEEMKEVTVTKSGIQTGVNLDTFFHYQK